MFKLYAQSGLFILIIHALCSTGNSDGTTSCALNQLNVAGRYYTTCPGGYVNEQNTCIHFAVPTCPPGYLLQQGLCYLSTQLPMQYCPSGYYKDCNQQCVIIGTAPIQTEPTPQPEPLPETDPLPEPLPTPEPLPEPALIIRCPTGSVLLNEKCRKIVCTQGEYYRGQCLQSACPEGTVWRGKRCQPPSYVTTIIEIDNVFSNELKRKAGQVVTEKVNNEYIYTSTPRTMFRPTLTKGTTSAPITHAPPIYVPPTNKTVGCCDIVTPRICKRYSAKWICFNRRYKRCDPELCMHPIIYIRTPKVVYEPPMLIMPPNPPLQACTEVGCEASDSVDCSGCAQNLRESCSPYCYRYMCPNHACAYVDQEKYCQMYPGEPGCTKYDGCPWDWCGEKCD